MDMVDKFDAFFVDEIESAQDRLQIQLSPYSKLYLLHLLKHLSENGDFFYSEVIQDKPLAVVIMEAIDKNLFEKSRDLKAVGDVSLIFSGLYPEHLTRRTMDIQYFIEMGRRSYSLLSQLYGPYKTKQELYRLYSILVNEFFSMIEILTEISAELHFMDEANMHKILSRWQSTRIRRYFEILKRNRIIPFEPSD